MRRMVLLTLALIALAVPAVVRAQNATPVAPAAEECTIAPITVERLAGLMATPVAATSPATNASPTPIALPEGTPANEATTAEIAAAAREFVACLNSGDNRRVLAFYSDNAILTLVLPGVGSGATPQDLIDQMTGGQPLDPEAQNVFYDVERVLVLDDGRVASLVVGDNLANDSPAGPALVYWVKVGDAWLIDDFISSDALAANS